VGLSLLPSGRALPSKSSSRRALKPTDAAKHQFAHRNSGLSRPIPKPFVSAQCRSPFLHFILPKEEPSKSLLNTDLQMHIWTMDLPENLRQKFRFDKTEFQILSMQAADQEMKKPYGDDPAERWAYLHYLKTRAYGLDPEKEIPFDRTHFEIIKKRD
jgi:hypothetical protein